MSIVLKIWLTGLILFVLAMGTRDEVDDDTPLAYLEEMYAIAFVTFTIIAVIWAIWR